MRGEFNNAHLDTICINWPQNIETTPDLKGLTPKSETALNIYWSETFNHGVHPFGHLLVFPLLFTSLRRAVKDGEE